MFIILNFEEHSGKLQKIIICSENKGKFNETMLKQKLERTGNFCYVIFGHSSKLISWKGDLVLGPIPVNFLDF